MIKDNDLTRLTEHDSKHKFSICLMNPPFSGSLHLDFLEKCIDVCNKTVCIEPGQWLVQLKENAKYTKDSSQAKRIKNKLKGHVKSIELNNYNRKLNVTNKTVCSIITTDFTKEYNEIDFECINEISKVNSLDDCNLIGNYGLVKSILNKCKNYKDHMIDHCIKLSKYKEYEGKGYWFMPYGNFMINCLSSNRGRNAEMFYQNDYKTHTVVDTNKFGDFYNAFTGVTANNNSKLYYNEIRKGVKRGSPTDNVYGTKEELENWKYYNVNNKLPLFINICLTIDENNNSREYVPWLVDKKYTDEEIYKLLNITKEEQELIDKTIERFERKSKWFKEYLLGK